MNECIFDIDPKLLSLASEAENECREMFEKIDSNAEYNGQKVLKAFIDNRVSEGCLKGTTGYGYGDMGRYHRQGVRSGTGRRRCFGKTHLCERDSCTVNSAFRSA